MPGGGSADGMVMSQHPKARDLPHTFHGQPARWLGMDEAESRLDPLGFQDWEREHPAVAHMRRQVADALELVGRLRACWGPSGGPALDRLPEWARPRPGEDLAALSMDLLRRRYQAFQASRRRWN